MSRPRKAWTPKATAASRTVRNAVGYVRVSTSDQADERTRLLEKMSASRIEKAKRGGVVGRPPYGYQIADARTEHARFIIDEAEAVIVRRIFQARREGQTFRAIADRLNADGVPSPSGRGAWSASRICQMVDQPIYIGTLRWREGDREVRTANAVPAILDTGFVPMFALPAVADQADHGFGLAS